MTKLPGENIKISLTAKEDIPIYSAIPPQTPFIDLSVDDFVNLVLIRIRSIHFKATQRSSNVFKIDQ